MHASAIVDLLVPALTAQGFAAHAFANSTPNGYGHKIALRFTNGNPLGSLVIYAGKKGPRYVTSELHAATPDLLGKIEQAWSSLGLSTQTAPPTTPNPPLPPAEPGTIELWVDGACLQQPDGLKFGWAFVLRRDGIELQQGSGRHIRPDSAHHRNVAAELEAVTRGLSACIRAGYRTITIYYDYAGIEHWATGQWARHTPMTQRYHRFITGLDLSLTWQKVPAHAGIPMNEWVDHLATSAARLSVERSADPKAPLMTD